MWLKIGHSAPCGDLGCVPLKTKNWEDLKNFELNGKRTWLKLLVGNGHVFFIRSNDIFADDGVLGEFLNPQVT